MQKGATHRLKASICFSVVLTSIFTATVCTRHVALYTCVQQVHAPHQRCRTTQTACACVLVLPERSPGLRHVNKPQGLPAVPMHNVCTYCSLNIALHAAQVQRSACK